MKMKGYESIKLKKALTIEEAYQALSQAETPLGKPELYTVLGSTGIQFPPYKGYKVVMSVTRKAITISSTYDGAKGLAKDAGPRGRTARPMRSLSWRMCAKGFLRITSRRAEGEVGPVRRGSCAVPAP